MSVAPSRGAAALKAATLKATQGTTAASPTTAGEFDIRLPLATDPTNQQWVFAFGTMNSDSDLFAIRRAGSASTEVHVLSNASGYQQEILTATTPFPSRSPTVDFALADWDFDGRPDLFAIMKSNTGTNTTEVHVLSGRSNYSTYVLHTGTAQPTTDGSWTFLVGDVDGDSVPDLIGLQRTNTPSGMTEASVYSGATNFGTLLFHQVTGLAATDANWRFTVGDYNGDGALDILATNRGATWTNSTEVHVLDGSQLFQGFLVQTPTNLSPASSAAFSVVAHLAGQWRVAQLDMSNTGTSRMHLSVSADAILYHGGEVMTGDVPVYFVFYGNVDQASSSVLGNLVTLLSGTPYFRINTTYGAKNGTPSGKLHWAGGVYDWYSHGTTLSLDDVKNVVNDRISAGSLPSDSNAIYVVFTAPDVNQVNSDGSFCSDYCGWHTHAHRTFSPWSDDLKYIWVGDSNYCVNHGLTSCWEQAVGTNGHPGPDGAASVLAHELDETVSDPYLDAWYSHQAPNDNENGDKCVWTFGPMGVAGGAYYNMTLGPFRYLIQQNFVNVGQNFGYCSMGGPTCGDGTCNGGETCSSCVNDCGVCPVVCGDGACTGNETCSSCPNDCGACGTCGDGVCSTSESCSTCSRDCGACPPVCGDGTCSSGETCSSCSQDCGACPPPTCRPQTSDCCGDGVCRSAAMCAKIGC